jgi:hypothetical protein
MKKKNSFHVTITVLIVHLQVLPDILGVSDGNMMISRKFLNSTLSDLEDAYESLHFKNDEPRKKYRKTYIEALSLLQMFFKNVRANKSFFRKNYMINIDDLNMLINNLKIIDKQNVLSFRN